MGNEVSQPQNYNNDTLNKINNVLNTNTEMYQPYQYGNGSVNWAKGMKFISKERKVSGTIISPNTNTGGIKEKIWNVVLDNGEQTVWAENDMINQEDEERKRKAIEDAKRIAEEKEAKRKEEAAEQARKRAEEEARRKEEAAEQARKRAEEEARRKEEEARRKAEAAEQERIRKEEARHKAEEDARHKTEEEARRKEEAAEQARRRAEEEARRKAEAAEQERLRKEAEKQKHITEINDEIRKNEILIENFETQLRTTSETLASRPDNERKGLINKLNEFETEKMKHVAIVNSLKQKLVAFK